MSKDYETADEDVHIGWLRDICNQGNTMMTFLSNSYVLLFDFFQFGDNRHLNAIFKRSAKINHFVQHKSEQASK